ncbi:MAG TPA: formate dehydrogenase accessory sulfurtransferase FdhD [Candidatus Acidoferrum sp.]|nr:formate dehydrogenase accessory sulfurtransferase FdhD [Candidatus Acidoferrum sp.]
MSSPLSNATRTRIIRWRGGVRSEVDDTLATEEPLEIRLGYRDARKGRVHKSLAITMRTPGDDLALALGFLHSESIIRSLADVHTIEQVNDNVVKVELQDAATFDPLRLERNFYVTSSCGVCGKSSLESLSTAGFNAITDDGFRISLVNLQRALAQLDQHQHLFRQTGGNHATALIDADGKLGRVTEDVGRHNAMDKLVGHCMQDGLLPLSRHAILVSGRASFELMQKALAAGAPLLVAVGAPSSLAVELAQEYNLTLVGFLGANGCNIYNGAFRISE